ncbi:hypothetical protein M378DRAFT_165059 [Amanita muscaria Koide BX008]|uniref:Uncharacterized protein n=1 Tax=Amanita muscaria (strain Koide BX008) TaxID=946122 RepID=A0A0C2SII1_AMAMK|nr:hypothetical protein M378DRAFT_165059 [Amanita muscaria Koide BX008]
MGRGASVNETRARFRVKPLHTNFFDRECSLSVGANNGLRVLGLLSPVAMPVPICICKKKTKKKRKQTSQPSLNEVKERKYRKLPAI